MSGLLAALTGAIGALLLGGALLLLLRRARDRRSGALVRVDDTLRGQAPFRSSRYRLVGRPDEIRRRRDGHLVPIEWKERSTPPGGPLPSHVAQVQAYCLLLEEATGRAPPYGLLRYGDGGEHRVPWDARARAELLRLRARMDRPYRGEAAPSPRKCSRCGWREGCDARSDG